MPTWLHGTILFFGLHKLLSRLEADPEGIVLGNLPLSMQTWIQNHAKSTLNLSTDLLVYLLPLLQPSRLREFHPTVKLYDLPAAAELAIFRPSPNVTAAPVLCFVHGGVWCLGSRHQYTSLGQRLASEGFVAVIIGYTTWPEASASEQVEQVRRAVRHVHAHAEEWGGDTAKIFLSGHSSGANITASALLGTSHDVPLCAGYIGMGGVYDVQAHYLYEKQRGVHNVSPLTPACEPLLEHSPTRIAAEFKLKLSCDRVLILHGEKDHTVPVSGAAMFALQLQKNQQQVQLIVTRHDDHTSFLVDMMLGRDCEILECIKSFCMSADQEVPPSNRVSVFDAKL